MILFCSYVDKLFSHSSCYDLSVGEYLALTGERLNGVDMLAVGLATHFSMRAVVPLLNFRKLCTHSLWFSYNIFSFLFVEA